MRGFRKQLILWFGSVHSRKTAPLREVSPSEGRRESVVKCRSSPGWVTTTSITPRVTNFRCSSAIVPKEELNGSQAMFPHLYPRGVRCRHRFDSVLRRESTDRRSFDLIFCCTHFIDGNCRTTPKAPTHTAAPQLGSAVMPSALGRSRRQFPPETELQTI
jgi:hypothetical protein